MTAEYVRPLPREECVLGPLLEKRAAEQGEAIFAVLQDGSTVTYVEMLGHARRAAAAFERLGVRKGDRVLSWLPNGLDALKVWFGANLLGAIYVPINTAYRGSLLEHVIKDSGARIGVVHAELAERLLDVDTAGLRQVILVNGTEPANDSLTYLPGDLLDEDPAREPHPEEPVQSWDVQSIIYTSGTAGPSKGVVSSYAHITASVLAVYEDRFRSDDRYMVNLPLFHAGGTIAVYAALKFGGSIAVVESFDTASFWELVRKTGSTWMVLVGAMANFLWKEPERPDDADNPLRMVAMLPLIDDVKGFAHRFNLTVITLFNMTETSVPIISEENPSTPGTCGRLREGIEARLVDDYDNEVEDGEVGELIVRTTQPWVMNSGYWKNPEATAEAWRNGWFHTADAFRRINSEYFFVDRKKDAIRRRGENISSFEVETEILAHPAVQEAAAVAVPSEYGEDDVLAVVAPVAGCTIQPAELLEFLRLRMAHFMIPRYVRVVDDLPRTPTARVRKDVLREQGVTPDTWDREQAGIKVKREHLA